MTVVLEGEIVGIFELSILAIITKRAEYSIMHGNSSGCFGLAAG